MPARYKLKRHREEQAHDNPPRHLRLEGSERQRAKKEVREGIKDADWDSDRMLRLEAAWEEEQRLAWECYQKELADPNHVCTCPDPFKDI